jgi:hypothetical protein
VFPDLSPASSEALVLPNNLDPFGLFGLPSDATMDQIRKKFRQLALAYHPDRHRGDDPAQAKKFRLVCEAYEAILRMREAAEREQAFGPCGICGNIAALVPKLDGTMVCTPCLVRPARLRLLPPPPLVILKCYFPIACLLSSVVLLVMQLVWETPGYGLAACATSVAGLIVVAVMGLLFPVQRPDDLKKSQELRSRRPAGWEFKL